MGKTHAERVAEKKAKAAATKKAKAAKVAAKTKAKRSKTLATKARQGRKAKRPDGGVTGSNIIEEHENDGIIAVWFRSGVIQVYGPKQALESCRSCKQKGFTWTEVSATQGFWSATATQATWKAAVRLVDSMVMTKHP